MLPVLSVLRDPNLRALLRGLSAEPVVPRRHEGECGVSVNHSTVHRWAVKPLPALEKVFRLRKRPVDQSWRMDRRGRRRS